MLESFEPTALMALSQRTALPLMQLLELAGKRPTVALVARGDKRTYGDLATHSALDEMAPRIAMLGVHTTHVFPMTPKGRGACPRWSTTATHAGSRSRRSRCGARPLLPRDFKIGDKPVRGDLARQVQGFVKAGADALITDHPGEVRAMVDTPIGLRAD